MEERGKDGPVIEISGNRTAVVDGCDGIVDYGPGGVILRMGRLTARFSGHDLRLKRLTASSAVIEGFLIGVQFEY